MAFVVRLGAYTASSHATGQNSTAGSASCRELVLPRGTATCSTQEAANPPAKMLDGIFDTHYSSMSGVPLICTLNLNASHSFDQVVLRYLGGSAPDHNGVVQKRTCSNWKMQYSTDSSNWTEPSGWDVSGATQARDEDVLSIATPSQAQYFKFTCSQMNSVDVKIREWEIYKPPPTPAPTPAPTSSSASASSSSSSNAGAVAGGVIGALVVVALALYCYCKGGQTTLAKMESTTSGVV